MSEEKDTFLEIRTPMGTERLPFMDEAQAVRWWEGRCKNWSASCDGETVELRRVEKVVIKSHTLVGGRRGGGEF